MPLIARWRYSPSVPSERSAFPVSPPLLPKTVTYSSRHFLSSLPSLQAHFPFCVVSGSEVLSSVVLLILRLITGNRGIHLRNGRQPPRYNSSILKSLFTFMCSAVQVPFGSLWKSPCSSTHAVICFSRLTGVRVCVRVCVHLLLSTGGQGVWPVY